MSANTTNTPEAERDQWCTPPQIFQWFHRRFQFAVDLAATDENALLPNFFTRDTDALARPWARLFPGRAGWCNPPYSNVAPWLEKARSEAGQGFTTVLFIPSPDGGRYYGQHVFGVASELIHIVGRVAYLNTEGDPQPGNRWGSCIVIYRAHDLGHTRYSHLWREDIIPARRGRKTKQVAA